MYQEMWIAFADSQLTKFKILQTIQRLDKADEKLSTDSEMIILLRVTLGELVTKISYGYNVKETDFTSNIY